MTIKHVRAIQHAQELLHVRELDAALRAFAHAEALGAHPDECSAGRWMAHMLQGNFIPAWAESDAIRAGGTTDPHRFWQGEDLLGKRVILRCLHGLGDAVQFFRYIPALRSMASSLMIEVPPTLLELAPHFTGVQDVITWGVDAPLVAPSWDVQVEINELPYLFRTTEEHLPLASRYLQIPGASIMNPVPRVNRASALQVGVVWASGEWKSSRSIPLELLQTVLGCDNCEFWNLQGGEVRQQWSLLTPGPHLNSAEVCAHSVMALASTIAHLDLVITSDTLAAHLAGALGVQCWVMLERAADWRWQHARDNSPWYPSLRLFRQDRDGDWTTVIERINRELHSESMQRRQAA